MNEDVPQERVLKTLIEDYRRKLDSIEQLKGYAKSLEQKCQRQDDMIKELREKLGAPIDEPYSDSYSRLKSKVSEMKEQITRLSNKCRIYRERLRRATAREAELMKANKEITAQLNHQKKVYKPDGTIAQGIMVAKLSYSITPTAEDLTPVYPRESGGMVFEYEDDANWGMGTAGELWAMQFERERLRGLNIDSEVTYVADGKIEGLGYDILSVEDDGTTPRYIEVKSTEKGPEISFWLTGNEYEKSQVLKDHYYIYRVIDFDRKAQRANLLIIDGDMMSNLPTYKYVAPLFDVNEPDATGTGT